ncbi:MAG: DsrE family protein [Pseudomonadota bacterium]|nr:MAG: DsrE family protein [Pseudomonadota bacterium]
MKDNQFSQEFLNAFVDDQLTAEEKSRAYPQISQDESLNRAVCELRKTRDLVQLAYRDVPTPPSRGLPQPRTGLLGLSLAAGIALGIGISLGWFLHEPKMPTVTTVAHQPLRPAGVSVVAAPAGALPSAPREVATPVTAGATQAVAPMSQTAKVLMHLSQGETSRLDQALTEIEQLVQYYRTSGQTARVEVVINSEGLNLVRSDVSPFPERVQRLQREYDNLAFVACQNTIDRLKREKGITAQLLPGVSVIDSGVVQLMRRQHQGWSYIQV